MILVDYSIFPSVLGSVICDELQQIFSQVDFRDCAIPNIFVDFRITVQRLANFDHEDELESQNRITSCVPIQNRWTMKRKTQRTRRGTQSRISYESDRFMTILTTTQNLKCTEDPRLVRFTFCKK